MSEWAERPSGFGCWLGVLIGCGVWAVVIYLFYVVFTRVHNALQQAG